MNFAPVSEAEFFAVMNPLDVHPRVDVASLRSRYHVSTWEAQHTRKIVGQSESDSYAIEPTRFFLARD
jgi:hypothetical protein